MLMPVGAKRITTENRCRGTYAIVWPSVMALISLAGADVMNSLANTLLLGQPTPQVREQAEAWVRKALAVIAAAKDQSKAEPDEAAHCDLVLAAALFNHGSLREVRESLMVNTATLSTITDGWRFGQRPQIVLGQPQTVLPAQPTRRRHPS